jgi:hypothetical protein
MKHCLSNDNVINSDSFLSAKTSTAGAEFSICIQTLSDLHNSYILEDPVQV